MLERTLPCMYELVASEGRRWGEGPADGKEEKNHIPLPQLKKLWAATAYS